jgi:DNA repair protein RadC
MSKMLDKNKHDRPREKLQTKGAQALSDFELLQALIGSGNQQADVSKIAKNTLKLLRQHGASISYERLREVTGMGAAKTTEILAAIELSRRFLLKSERPIIDTLHDATKQLEAIRDKKQEHFVCITLDGAHRLIASRVITIGTLTSSLVHPREVFADAITDRAAGIIVAHNHPSGSLQPSADDHEVTHILAETGAILGIDLVDHIIVTETASVSII